MTFAIRSGQRAQDAPTEQTRNFTGTAVRLLRRLAPQRWPAMAVISLSMCGIMISVIGPRILGHATDLLFNGVLGRQFPAGTTREQAIAAARQRGDNTLADLLSGTNAVPGQGVDFGAVARTLLLALSLYFVAALMVYIQARLLNVTVQRTMVALRADVEDKIHRLPLSHFDTALRGELMSRVTNDVDNIQLSLSITISQLLTSALTVVAVLAMMLTISLQLTLIAVVTVPLSLWVTRVIARRSQRMFVAQWRNIGRLNAHIEETYSGFTVVRTFGHSATAREQFRKLNDDVFETGFGAQFLSGLVSPATIFVGNLGYVAVAVVGGLQVATGQITLGAIQAFIQYVRQFNQPLTQVAGMYNSLQSGIASAERVFEFLDEPEQQADTDVDLPTRRSAPRVEFRHVSFGYRAGIPVIEDLSLIAESGSTVAIVGPTGAGKTTLVNLLMRFYEVDRGQILIDGVDTATVSRQSLRSQIGMVLQDTWLFAGTIAENIAYGKPDATRSDVVAAARSAHVDRFVERLPDGYDTIVGEGGVISAGERQLITIARAILAMPRLLILDEATSSVDTRTELLIAQAMAELRRDRTSFVIAHRLSTIRDADLILVMDAGRIVEQGTHTELLSRRGTYWAMVNA